MKYGWYYERDECQIEGEGNDLWEMLGKVIPQAVEDGSLKLLRAGALVTPTVDEYIDREYLADLIEDDVCSSENVVDLIREGYTEIHWEAGCSYPDKAAEAAFEGIMKSHPKGSEELIDAIVKWALEHLELDPSSYYEGVNPLPIEYVNNAWTYGRKERYTSDEETKNAEAEAVVIYATVASPETGHIGWCWWALGKMGNSPTLKEAMATAEAKVAAQRALSQDGAQRALSQEVER